jgi:uncharacterized protein (TIGR03437 family)
VVQTRSNTAPELLDASSTTIRTPSVTLGEVQTSTNFVGLAPGYVGVYKVNALVPTTIAPGLSVTLSLSIDGVSSKYGVYCGAIAPNR